MRVRFRFRCRGLYAVRKSLELLVRRFLSPETSLTAARWGNILFKSTSELYEYCHASKLYVRNWAISVTDPMNLINYCDNGLGGLISVTLGNVQLSRTYGSGITIIHAFFGQTNFQKPGSENAKTRQCTDKIQPKTRSRVLGHSITSTLSHNMNLFSTRLL